MRKEKICKIIRKGNIQDSYNQWTNIVESATQQVNKKK